MCEQTNIRHLEFLLSSQEREIERLRDLVSDTIDRAYLAESKLRQLTQLYESEHQLPPAA